MIQDQPMKSDIVSHTHQRELWAVYIARLWIDCQGRSRTIGRAKYVAADDKELCIVKGSSWTHQWPPPVQKHVNFQCQIMHKLHLPIFDISAASESMADDHAIVSLVVQLTP